jgi:ArsR family transcriptional regulator, arsenate/arsenite/antimonite-responsive transcriptional repressor
MESKEAIGALLALGQETRLAAFQLLMEQGPPGLSVGEIAGCLEVNFSTLSRHLAQLERASLLRSWRKERQVFYAVDHAGARAIIQFLTEDCCKADPDICGRYSRQRAAARTSKSI